MSVEHRCGHELAPRLVCEACGEPVSPRDTRPVYPERRGLEPQAFGAAVAGV